MSHLGPKVLSAIHSMSAIWGLRYLEVLLYKCYIILFSFSSKSTFSPSLLLKACIVYGQEIISFEDFFFEANFIGSKTLNVMPWISQSSEIKSITESF